jgi:hypothetical protein
MSIRTQKRILLVTIPLVVIFPSICAVSALWTHTISSFEVVAISIAAVGASLLVIGVFVLMYLGERGEPAAQPDHWEQELRKVFFILILLVSGLHLEGKCRRDYCCSDSGCTYFDWVTSDYRTFCNGEYVAETQRYSKCQK